MKSLGKMRRLMNYEGIFAHVRMFLNHLYERDIFIVRTRFGNYSDVFSAFYNITSEPIAQQMIEIERECDIELERKGFSAIQRSQLADFFRNDRREHIARKCGGFKRDNTYKELFQLHPNANRFKKG
ncbi:unnamed protein product [Strongylus vulgaris]|uniref:Uncharacterized protein n=1 Tax=Strongylus vulgaris TaxID=40348 RepID=A0A3P7J730_STRVU|nr:unnamed protein product [Strongylus vulgaris]